MIITMSEPCHLLSDGLKSCMFSVFIKIICNVCTTVYALKFHHPKYSSLATKGCNSVVIGDKIDVIYLLILDF